MSILQKLTEGVVNRDVSRESQALLSKWEQTGLLEGLDSERNRQGMAVLLENQAKELLREASQMSAGDVEGFAAVAFPIVRRVFGGLIANDLVSVQPMSLPSGLIFFMDFIHSPDKRTNLPQSGQSVYGGNVVAAQLTGGVDLDGHTAAESGAPGGFYNLQTGRSHATGSVLAHSGVGFKMNGTPVIGAVADGGKLVSALTEAEKKILRYDPDILAMGSTARVLVLDTVADATTLCPGLNTDALTAVQLQREPAAHDSGAKAGRIVVNDGGAQNAGATDQLDDGVMQIRRLTSITTGGKLRVVLVHSAGVIKIDANEDGTGTEDLTLSADEFGIVFPVKDEFVSGGNGGLGSVRGGQSSQGFELESEQNMAEIDIKVDSIAVTAQTKKLKAKWTPELAQDLNAYHNLDAEVELTGILSEQIALEIDQEILGDLIQGAKAGTRYWSRAPGLFVDSSGAELGAASAAPDFTGTVSEWYETLIETINDVSAQIHRKTLRGGANFCVCSPEVASILEMTSGFRANVTVDSDRGDIGAVKTGSLTKKFDLYVDPYFPRNVVLVGRKGSSFLESGFVYAPYVPLQVTPTIFGTEDFVPRKGVMTRYGKKMVRPDMYGLVIVRGLLGEQGAS